MARDREASKPPRLKLPGEASYEVGYGKPPEGRQFRKGISGNPKGRPKGARSITGNRLHDIIKAEAYRTIRAPDNGGVITLTIAEAVMRSIAVNAAKGQARAQRLFTELLHEMERAEFAVRYETLQALLAYKVQWDEELDRRRRCGIVAADPVPHPDDVFVNLRTGEARVIGPISKEEKAAFDRWLLQRDRVEAKFGEQLALPRRQRSGATWRKNIALLQHFYDKYNDALPPHYQKRLTSRLEISPQEHAAAVAAFKEIDRKARSKK